MSTTRKEATESIGPYRRAATEKHDFPAKRRRPAVKDHPTDSAAAPGPVESLAGVVHEWVRQYQPALFERIRSKEIQVKDLAAQTAAGGEAKVQEALRQRLDSEKRELVALVWDAIGLFEGKPLTEPEIQGRQLGLLVEMIDPAGQTLYVPRGLVEPYLKEGYQLITPAPPAE